MSWLFFVDESGHDHASCPFEVRGGIAVRTGRLWRLIQSLQRIETDCFGCRLSDWGHEIKGAKLLGPKRLRHAKQAESLFSDEERKKHVAAFLEKGKMQKTPAKNEFAAYGQACIMMAERVFEELYHHEAVIIASIVPRGVRRPEGFLYEDYLRKDQVFLFERFFYLLEEYDTEGLVIMDKVEKSADRKFIGRIEKYFVATWKGRERATRIVPTPFFVESDLVYAIQAADICIYTINWGFRRIGRMGDAGEVRKELSERFEDWLFRLQFKKKGLEYAENRLTDSYGIFYVSDPYTSRKKRKEAKRSVQP